MTVLAMAWHDGRPAHFMDTALKPVWRPPVLSTLWFPAYAGMTVKNAWNDSEGRME